MSPSCKIHSILLYDCNFLTNTVQITHVFFTRMRTRVTVRHCKCSASGRSNGTRLVCRLQLIKVRDVVESKHLVSAATSNLECNSLTQGHCSLRPTYSISDSKWLHLSDQSDSRCISRHTLKSAKSVSQKYVQWVCTERQALTAVYL